jgi:hypothetical protein
MRSRTTRSSILALAASLALAGAALAGGWAAAVLDEGTVAPAAGTTTTLGFRVLQHGVTPVSWVKVTLVATNTATGEAVSATATPQGPEGHYVATLTFPASGDWTLSWDSSDLLMRQPPTTLTVAAAPAAPPGGTVDGTVLAVAAVVLLGLAGGAMALMRRRAVAPVVSRAG